jgi:hypothetical protein
MRRPSLDALPAVCLVVCCLLAGCNALAPGGTAGDGAVPEVTPAEVPADPTGTPTPEPAARLAPGLTEAGIVNGTALLRAHESALANRSVAVTQRVTTRLDNGSTLDEQVIEYRFGPERSRVAVEADGLDGSASSVGVWSNGTATLVREGTGEDASYDVQERGFAGYTPTTAFGPALRPDDDRRATSVERLGSEDGLALYRVTVERADGSTAVLTVDERGVVRRAVESGVGPLVGSGERADTTTTRVTTLSLTLGPPDPPEWVADARERIVDREYVAPGVTTERVVDAYALVDAHAALVEGRSLTTTTERWSNASNGSVLRYERTVVRASADRSERRALTVRRDDGPTRRTDGWTNGSADYRRFAVDGEVTYDPAGPGARLDEPDLLRLAGGDPTVEALGDGRYRLVAEGIAALPRGVDAASNPRLVVVFDERGFLSRVTRTYTVADGDETRTVRRTTRYTALGETTVERPDWVPAAANATGD